MAIDIKFDLTNNPELPTIILATRSGKKLGQLEARKIEVCDKLNDASEITFILNKYIDGRITNLWDKVVDFKLVYCKEWDMWFEITVELDEETETTKTVFCTQLGQAELSQIMLYNIHINEEGDPNWDDEKEEYKISILYDPFNPDASILHRMLEKAPHYSIIHVDPTIAKLQRTFSFDGTSIYDGFQEIAEEIGCLFEFHDLKSECNECHYRAEFTGNCPICGSSNIEVNEGYNNIRRTISVYDLESNCKDCGHRGEFTGDCPKCGSPDVIEGYGDDTTIFVTVDELADNISLSGDSDSVKNCFKLEAGDDLMTATIRNCNPNGSDYIWRISESTKEDMSDELIQKINSYDNEYKRYQEKYRINLNEDALEKYNTLVRKYQKYNKELEEIRTSIVGYPDLMQAYYNTIDLKLYLESSLMPTVEMSDTSAELEAAKLISSNLSPVSTESIKYLSEGTAENIVLSMAKVIVDSRYKVTPYESHFNDGNLLKVWTGRFKVENYSDEEDYAISTSVSVNIDDNYENFLEQKIDKLLNKDDTDDYSVSGLFAKQYDDFVEELKKYSLNCLIAVESSCQSCIDILIDQGIGNKETWSGQSPNLYNDLYLAYKNKLSAIKAEAKVRQEEIDLIDGIYNDKDELVVYGLQNYIEEVQKDIQNKLDFEKHLGDLWLEFCSFRREDKYSNDNYISDGLNNALLFDNAWKFIEVAQNEILKSSELQHSISSSLKNLLAIKKFEPLVKNFKVGNWLRVLINDEIYKLRLIEYSIDYDNFDNISVEFSDVAKHKSTAKSIKGVIDQAAKMATSYGAVQKQAQQGEKSNSTLNNWSLKGLDTTNTKIILGANSQTQTWDEHGMLFKKYDEVTNTYSDTQLKIVNSTMAITDDGWETVKTAVGEYYYFDPVTNELKKAYGVNAEVLVGKLILGEQLGIYNETGSLTFDNNGLKITNGVNSFNVNPDQDMLLSISNKVKDENGNEEEKYVFYVDKTGGLYVDGSGVDISGNAVFTSFKQGLANGSTIISGDCIQTGTIDASRASITNINASNITTGTMSAERVNMTGAITWGDLSDSVKNTIYSQSTDLPDYIESTYIDFSKVETPTIIANEANVLGVLKVGYGTQSSNETGGYIGCAYGSAYDEESGSYKTTYGIALSDSSTGDYINHATNGRYVVVTDSGARIQAYNNNIALTEDNIYLSVRNSYAGERISWINLNKYGAYYNGDSESPLREIATLEDLQNFDYNFQHIDMVNEDGEVYGWLGSTEGSMEDGTTTYGFYIAAGSTHDMTEEAIDSVGQYIRITDGGIRLHCSDETRMTLTTNGNITMHGNVFANGSRVVTVEMLAEWGLIHG